MYVEGSLPCSQKSASGPYSEPDESRPQIPTLFKISSDIILPCSSRPPKYPPVFWFSD